jgi:formylglycine-generating enzyme required for sulfatase activity
VKVSWFDAVAFCKWLTEKEQNENLIDDREFYRLPTDAEWSMAVGLLNENGPTPEARDSKIKNEFPWGKQWPAPGDAGNYASPRRRIATLPVGSFKSNSVGLYDLGGNVWEWCLDTYKGENNATGRDW